MHPELWPPTNDLADLLSEFGSGKNDLERALALAQKAKSLSPENPAIFDTLGWIYYRRGDVNQAIEWLGKAQTKNAENPIVNFHLGMAYNRAGNPGKAKEYLRIALASKVNFRGREEAEKAIAGIR
jgi:Flp pilus assembly protein TadD